MHRSLTKRIISLSIFWIVLALVATGLLLGRLYSQHIEEHYDAHVFTHVEELIAAVKTERGPASRTHGPALSSAQLGMVLADSQRRPAAAEVGLA